MPTHQELPERFGRYRILKKLGEGGMGAVYLAEDTELERRVAVKVPHLSEADGQTVIDRFHREARLAAAVDHPNICPVHDVGEYGGVHFLVMPFIDGTPLSRLVHADRPWPPEQALALVRKVALAVEVMHQRGLIHRDLKPGNVLIRSSGEPVLMDFGLARSFTEQSRQLTVTGATVGTPAYMSPEQVLGQKDIKPATDIYSMGVILYELLTGCLPFVGPEGMVYGQILYAAPEPPSARRPGLDAGLDTLCLKAMAKEPGQRFASMTEMATALGGICQTLPPTVSESPAPSAETIPPTREPSLAPAPTSLPKEFVNSIGMKLVLVGPGKFLMGSPDEEKDRFDKEGPQHEVEITRPFYLGAFQVTQEEYETVMGSNPSHFTRQRGGGPKHPVEQVSWDEAVAFCRLAG